MESDIITIQDAVEKYKDTPEFKIKLRSDKTRNQYAYQLRRLCEAELEGGSIGSICIDTLNVAKCQCIYWQLIEDVDTNDVRFANYTMQIVIRVWNVLIKYDYLDKNPWGFVEKSKVSPRNTVWQSEDFKIFLQTAFSIPKWRNIGLLVRINVEIGQRIEDVRLSQWDNYDLNEKLYMREVIQKTHERIPGIPLSDSLVQMLQEQKEVYEFQEWVVPHPFLLEPYSEHSISRTFRKIMNTAGLSSRLQLRDIRRTVLTDLANHGATDTEIMAYSGHKSRESLMPYVCISTEQARNAANKRNFSIEDIEEWKRYERSLMSTEQLLSKVKFKDE
jgi:integrase